MGFDLKYFYSKLCHINVSNCYVILWLGLPYPQDNTVVFVFKERKYFFFFIAIGTDVLLMNDHV